MPSLFTHITFFSMAIKRNSTIISINYQITWYSLVAHHGHNSNSIGHFRHVKSVAKSYIMNLTIATQSIGRKTQTALYRVTVDKFLRASATPVHDTINIPNTNRLKVHNSVTIRSRRKSNFSQITNKLNCINLLSGKRMNDSGRNMNTRSSSRKFRNIKSNCARQIRRQGSEERVGNPKLNQKVELEAQPRPKRKESRTPPKIKRVKRKGSKKKNRKMTKQPHHNPKKGLLKKVCFFTLHK